MYYQHSYLSYSLINNAKNKLFNIRGIFYRGSKDKRHTKAQTLR